MPGVNNHRSYGRWAFAEFRDVYAMQSDFAARVEAEFDKMIERMDGGSADSSLTGEWNTPVGNEPMRRPQN